MRMRIRKRHSSDTYVTFSVVAKFFRKSMGTQKGRDDASRVVALLRCPKHFCLSFRRQTITRLNFHGCDTFLTILWTLDFALRTSSSNEAFRVFSTVERIPPPALAMSAYFSPASRRANSSALEPAHTVCVWQSTSPGNPTRPFPSITTPAEFFPSIASDEEESPRRKFYHQQIR